MKLTLTAEFVFKTKVLFVEYNKQKTYFLTFFDKPTVKTAKVKP